MAKCLITTLKEAVTDASLRKLGELVIHAPAGLVLIKMNTTATITMNIEGEGHFTDSSGTSNLGKERTFAPQTGRTDIYVTSTNGCNVTFSNKYVLVALQSRGCLVEAEQLYASQGLLYLDLALDGDIEVVKTIPNVRFLSCPNYDGTYGNISAVSDLDSMTELILYDTNVEGNLSALAAKSNIVNLEIQNTKVSGNLSSLSSMHSMVILTIQNNNIEGNISNLSNMTSMQTLAMENTNISGNISALSGMTNLKLLRVDNTNVTGDTSSLANCTQLTTFTYTNTAITGTWPLV